MKYFVILLVFVGFFGLVYAAPEQIPEDDFKYSDYVITGKIISSEIVPDLREDNSAATFYDTVIYQVKVEEWHKNQMVNNIITVYGTYFPKDVTPEPNWGVVEFEIGDTVYLYIDKTEDGLKFREYGSKLLTSTDLDPVPKTNEYSEFIDFQPIYQAKMPIQFILENTSYGSCDSFNAKITDKKGNTIVGEAKESLCVATQQPPILVISQIKIGYDEDNPIIINKSGIYYLEVEFDDVFIKREFVVRQNYSGANFDSTDYSNSQEFLSPLKQIKSGIALIDVECNEEKIPVYKYNRLSVACVSEETQNELWSRGWTTMRFYTDEDISPHALCNNYEGKWHPEYEGCRDITDLQCSLMGGEFVDDLKICYNEICPVDRTYTLCVTNLDLISGEIKNEK